MLLLLGHTGMEWVWVTGEGTGGYVQSRRDGDPWNPDAMRIRLLGYPGAGV